MPKENQKKSKKIKTPEEFYKKISPDHPFNNKEFEDKPYFSFIAMMEFSKMYSNYLKKKYKK